VKSDELQSTAYQENCMRRRLLEWVTDTRRGDTVNRRSVGDSVNCLRLRRH